MPANSEAVILEPNPVAGTAKLRNVRATPSFTGWILGSTHIDPVVSTQPVRTPPALDARHHRKRPGPRSKSLRTRDSDGCVRASRAVGVLTRCSSIPAPIVARPLSAGRLRAATGPCGSRAENAGARPTNCPSGPPRELPLAPSRCPRPSLVHPTAVPLALLHLDLAGRPHARAELRVLPSRGGGGGGCAVRGRRGDRRCRDVALPA